MNFHSAFWLFRFAAAAVVVVSKNIITIISAKACA
jgi:hypothetical protein